MNFHQIFHIIISIYVIFGWAIYPQGHAPVCFGIILHWLLNKGRCVFSGEYADDNGFTMEILGKVGINISENEWLKKLVPYILVLLPALVSVYMSFRDVQFFGGTVGIKTMTVLMSGTIGISIWQALKGMLGLADSTTQTVTDSPTEAPEVPATSGDAVADADANTDRVSTA